MVFVYKITALIIVFCLFDYAATYTCSIGWHHGYRDNCYYFSRFSATFWSAMSFCKTVGGKLIEIDNYWEFQVLSRMARHRRFPDFWIGITDMYSEGAWQKATTQEQQTYFNWYESQPSNSGGHENCVEVYTKLGMKWNDRHGDHRLRFVCEK
uniref:Putative C-type lectin n=1 Tax=Mytilus edulis TaxID=6550 RepID=D7REG2_MYTED|nr:putative C-type lectin [Mytilus edulis]